jgi:hypothetical protein
MSIEVGKRYFVGDKMRWVLAVGNDRVIYSRGGDKHYECLVKTFARWLKGGGEEGGPSPSEAELR